MFVIKFKKIFFAIAIFLVVGSLAIMASRGFVWGVDFTGGSVLEVSYDVRPDIESIKKAVTVVSPDAQVQAIGSDGVMIRTGVIDQAQK